MVDSTRMEPNEFVHWYNDLISEAYDKRLLILINDKPITFANAYKEYKDVWKTLTPKEQFEILLES